MNIKKIGMTALAASLVSTSVFAGELTATGTASITCRKLLGTYKTLEKDFQWEINLLSQVVRRIRQWNDCFNVF